MSLSSGECVDLLNHLTFLHVVYNTQQNKQRDEFQAQKRLQALYDIPFVYLWPDKQCSSLSELEEHEEELILMGSNSNLAGGSGRAYFKVPKWLAVNADEIFEP